MKLLGVDYGEKRTGVAVSDMTGFLATGLCTLSLGGMRKTAKAVLDKAYENKCEKIILGFPLNMDGSEGPRAEASRVFRQMLLDYSGGDIEVELYDERLTTVDAHEILSFVNIKSKKRKSVVDTLAAELILQSYLDKKKEEKRRKEAEENNIKEADSE